MNSPESLSQSAQEVVEHKVRRAAGIHALRKIGGIVAEEQKVDAEKASVLRWAARYGWLLVLAGGVLLAWMVGVI
jgi:hypothetical protein